MGSNRDIHLLSPSPKFYLGHSGNICPGLTPAMPGIWG